MLQRAFVCSGVLSLVAAGGTGIVKDHRYVRNGAVMLATGYTDQPYCAVRPASKTDKEIWTCVITASFGGEGSAGEQVYSVWSDDQGATWSDPASVENGTTHPGGLPNAYANIVYAEALDRFYTVFNLNLDNVTMPKRVDELGYFYMRSSDDHGRTWSPDRHLVPYPNTWVDRHNTFNGTHHIMWTVDQIKFMPNEAVAFGFTKIGTYIQSPPEEVFFMSSPNLLHEPDPSKVTWELLPRNEDHGVRAPDIYNQNTTVMEEGHLVPRVGSGGCYAMGRTDKGFIAASWTNDSTAAAGWLNNGAGTKLARYWDPRPRVATPLSTLQDIDLNKSAVDALSEGPVTLYETALKSLRGPFTPKALPNGRYLLIYYNNNAGRDPYYLSAGIESQTDGQILWSQPELVLYDRVHVGTAAGGYPDFINGASGTFLTVAQKGVPGTNSTSYVHRIDEGLLSQLLNQHNASQRPDSDQLVVAFNASTQNQTVPLPSGLAWPTFELPLTQQRQGFSVVLLVASGALAAATDAAPISLMKSGNVSVSYAPSQGLTLRFVGNRTNCTTCAGENTEPQYELVRNGYQPKHDDALPGVPCQNGVFSGTGADKAALGCAEMCSETADCGAFWSYTDPKSAVYGRCCLKGTNWVNSSNPQDWTRIDHGGFYAMTGPPSPNVAQTVSTDAACSALLQHIASNDGDAHTLAVIVDAGAQVASFVVDGLLCDGGGASTAGFFWTSPDMGQVFGGSVVEIGSGLPSASLLDGGLYFRALFTSEVVALHRSRS